MSEAKIKEAIKFCVESHNSIGQKRKYSNAPYWVHPLEVSEIIASWGMDETTQIAALLHDVPEDVYEKDIQKGFNEVTRRFGEEVSQVVYYCTEISAGSKELRPIRKAVDREHYTKGCYRSQAIKIADAMSNLPSIKEGDPGFYKIYLQEKIAMVAVLTKAPQEALDAWGKFLRRLEKKRKP